MPAFTVDEAGAVRSWNAAAETATGVAAAEVLGHLPPLAEADRTAFLAAVRSALDEGGPVTLALPVLGAAKAVTLKGAPYAPSGGRGVAWALVGCCAGAERALRDHEHRLRVILEAVPAPIFFKDAAGAYQGCNAAFERYLGHSRAEIVGRTVRDVAPPDLAEIYRAADEALLRQGGTQVYEAQVEWGDGTRRDTLFSKAVYRDACGEVAGLAGTMLDVTEQRRAERALKARLRQQAGLARLAQHALELLELEALADEALRVAAEALEVTGGALVEVVASGRGEPPALRKLGRLAGRPGVPAPEAVAALVEALLSANGPLSVEDSDAVSGPVPAALRALGARAWAAVRVGPRDAPLGLLAVHAEAPHAFRDEDLAFLDAVGHVLAVALARKRAVRAARGSELSLRRLVDTTPDLVVIHRDGRAIYVNPALAALLGGSAGALLGVDVVREWVHPDDQPAAEARWRGHGPQAPLEIRVRNAAGGWTHAEFVGLDVELDGRPARLSLGRDLTERRAAQARLALSDRLATIGTLAAGVAHELANPLAFVRANLEYAAHELDRSGTAPGRAQAKLALAEAAEGARRMEVIVRDLRTLSRPDEARAGPVPVPRLLEFAAKLAGAALRDRARLVLAFEPVPPVLGNEARLGQVFLNLLVNAAQAIPPGAPAANEVRVSTRMAPGGRVQVDVADTGPGIPGGLRDRIFEPFFTTKAVGEGTGLGLWVSRDIVTAHGGEISVESPPGGGTVFRVFLPAAPESVDN